MPVHRYGATATAADSQHPRYAFRVNADDDSEDLRQANLAPPLWAYYSEPDDF
jgi:hypothetical protein